MKLLLTISLILLSGCAGSNTSSELNPNAVSSNHETEYFKRINVVDVPYGLFERARISSNGKYEILQFKLQRSGSQLEVSDVSVECGTYRFFSPHGTLVGLIPTTGGSASRSLNLYKDSQYANHYGGQFVLTKSGYTDSTYYNPEVSPIEDLAVGTTLARCNLN